MPKNLFEQVRQEAERAFVSHRIRVLHFNQFYRHYQCGEWTSSGDLLVAGSFEVMAYPHHLVLSGDLGELMLRRTENMLAWGAHAIQDVQYFAEKVFAHGFMGNSLPIRDTRGKKQLTRRFLWQYEACRWFFRNWQDRQKYYVPEGTEHEQVFGLPPAR